MAIIKCKMCGGDLNITEGLTIAECEYCGSMQTIPTADNEKKMTLFSRAIRLLRGCEFDKAAGVFENIVAEFPEEAEAYWGLLLCKYGIEYVDDPVTGKKVPTCHRSSFDSVLDDVNFELACENTDALARRQYRNEARQIEALRRAIIEVSGREEPYDLFISYKETDEKGERTLDSVIAQDIYDAFTQEAFRVFFSRISLEDKLGVEYEPYIFAALNSANVMLVVGTDYENFDSVWVKNEWSRFLKLMTQDKSKHLIPVYKNMDPYDMPKEFVKLAAQDMGKLGAMQDLIRGVKKMMAPKKAPVEEKRETVVIQQSSGGPNVRAMIDRGNMALEDNKWNDAADFFNRALDMDAKCSEAYLGLFLIENNSVSPKAFVALILRQNEDCEVIVLEACPEDTQRMQRIIEENYVLPQYQKRESIERLFPFDRTYESSFESRNSQLIAVKAWLEQNKNLVRAFKFADGNALEILQDMYNGILSGLQARVDKARAEAEANKARIQDDYAAHLDMVEAEAKRQREAAQAQQEADYVAACEYADRVTTEHLLIDAAERLSAPKLRDYKDCAQRAAECKQKAEQIKADRLAAQEAERQHILAEKEAERKRKAAEKEERKRLAAEEAERKRTLARARNAELMAKAKKAVVALCALAVVAAAGIFIVPKVMEAAPAMIEKMEQAKAEKEEKNAQGEASEEAVAQEQGETEQQERLEIKLSPRTETQTTILAAADHTLALKADGTVVSAGFNDKNKRDMSALTDVVSISSGDRHTVVLKSNGTVAVVHASWSGGLMKDIWNRLISIDRSWSDIITVSSAYNHTIGLKSNGTVVAEGDNDYGQCDVSSWSDITYISTNSKHTVGLKSDGTVVAVGDNKYGQCDVSDWADVISVSAGANHTVGLKSDGTVVAAGHNKQGQCDVSGWNDIVAVCAGTNHTVGLKSDGNVVAVGYNELGQCNVSDWVNIVAISSTKNHTVGLKFDGTVVAVGSNTQGQCDVFGLTDIMLPEGIEIQTATAESEETGNISWELSDDGTLTISGSGRMEDYTAKVDSKNPAPWRLDGLDKKIRKVVIGPGISYVGSKAFWECDNLQEAVLCQGITEIGEYAFDKAEGLRTVVLPDSLEIIGNNAFNWCHSLREINLPEGLKELGKGAFNDCTSLTQVQLPSTLKTIGTSAFSTCKALKSVTIHEGVEKIDTYTFSSCTSLYSVELPSTLRNIGLGAFDGCANLYNVVYMGSINEWEKVTVVGHNEPLLNANIEFMTLASGTAGENISWMLDKDGTLTISGSGELPNGATVGGGSFLSHLNNKIKKIVVEEGISAVGSGSFKGLMNLEELVLPGSLTSIGREAFSGCISLKKVHFTGTEEQWAKVSMDESNNRVLSIAECLYIAAGTSWENINWVLTNDGTLTISGTGAITTGTSRGSFVGRWNTDIKKIVVEEGITSVGNYSFYHLTHLEEVVLPNGLESIGEMAFANCFELSYINFPDSITQIHENAFVGTQFQR